MDAERFCANGLLYFLFLQLTLSLSLFNKQKLKALNPQCRFVFGHISSRDTFWKFISPDYV